MKILPPQTRPPDQTISRQHSPRPVGRWTEFRDCLRWEFGFTCAFCLLHEADLFGGLGGEGLGGTTVEHYVPRSTDPSLESEYSNCLYACRFCNRARSSRPHADDRHRLLEPTRDVWADHFQLSGDRLEPSPEDEDATYTLEAYDLNEPRKTVRRQVRRLLIEDRMKLVESWEQEIGELLSLADEIRREIPHSSEEP